MGSSTPGRERGALVLTRRDASDLLPNCLLAGHFQMLCNLPAHGQFNVAIDAYVDNDRAIFDGERFIDLAEIVGPVDSEALGAKADGQFFEIGLSDFRVFRRETLVDEVVALLPDSIVVKDKHGERQIVTDGGVEIGHVHHERCIGGDVRDPLARPRKTSAQRDAQALPDRPEVQSERPVVGAGTTEGLARHHCGVTAVEDENAIAFRQLVFQIRVAGKIVLMPSSA